MCGIIGIQGSDSAAAEIFQGLLLLQHRGQDAAGILSFDQHTKQFHLHKDKGLVGQVFNEKNLSTLEGNAAIAHTRYATTVTKESAGSRDLQPMLVNYPHGLGLVHNGNIINMDDLTATLMKQHHRIMLSKNDAEILLNVLSTQIQNSMGEDPLEQLKQASQKVFDEALGGYAIIAVWANGHLFGMRDPHGIRPLVMGKKIKPDGTVAHILASESNVLTFLGYEFLRDIQPGEMVAIDQAGIVSSSHSQIVKEKAPCMFEWVYFATPESVMDGTPVYTARLNLGKQLGLKIRKLMQEKKLDVDVVVPVPESGRIAAIALSETIGVPYRELLIKNRYIQRSFILKDQESRNRAVHMKLMAVGAELKGKKVLIVDDSIVRGTTSKRLIETLKAAGAKEVTFVSTCPPITNPCYFGIDFPLTEELIASTMDEKALADFLGVTAVIYQDLAGLKEALNQANICQGCITGEYPFDTKDFGTKFRQARLLSEHV